MDRNTYLAQGEKNYAMRALVEKIADEVCEAGFDNIFLFGSGGSLLMLDTFRWLFFQRSDIPVYALSAAEALTCKTAQLGPRSLAVMLTLNGTAEIASVARMLDGQKIRSVAFVGVPDCEPGRLATHCIYNEEKDTTLRYLMLAFFFFRILHNRGFLPDYGRFAEQLRGLPAALWEAGEGFAPLAAQIAETAGRESFVAWISSGAAYSETFRYANCTVEEMVRIKTQTINSAEFFHGSFEIVDEELCAVLVKNVDGNRALEDRVEAFLRRFGKKFFVVDLLEAKMPGIDREFRPLLVSPLITMIFKNHLQPQLERITGRSAKTRRYYGVERY